MIGRDDVGQVSLQRLNLQPTHFVLVAELVIVLLGKILQKVLRVADEEEGVGIARSEGTVNELHRGYRRAVDPAIPFGDLAR